MPTPVGHAIGGLAAAFLTSAATGRSRLTKQVLASALALAMVPDLDILAGSHRTYTHSIGAVALVGLLARLVLRTRHVGASPLALALTAAYGSHLMLDLLGKDTSQPPGLMALWPFRSRFYMSGWDIFGEVSRRYWLPSEFIFGNLQALAWEMLLLVPLLLFAWVLWSRRTLHA
jgi:membrane-bound metal-dependent hydrolase YbcI (DUF457 family)